MKNSIIGLKKYPVYCPWCQEEGNTTLVAMSPVENSSGICKAHAAELRKQANKLAAQRTAQLTLFNR